MFSLSKLELTRVPATVVGPVTALAEALVQAGAAERVAALVVFGPAARSAGAGFDARRDRIDSAVVLEEMDLRLLNGLRPYGAALGHRGLRAPLVMTPADIAASRDTYPVELLEIQQAHLVVYGRDYFSALQFSSADMRLQCERALRASLLNLRQALLSAADRDELLPGLCGNCAEGLVRILRALLWIERVPAPAAEDELIAAAARTCGIELSHLASARRARQPADFAAFGRVYAEVERLAAWVDAAAPAAPHSARRADTDTNRGERPSSLDVPN